VEAVAEGGDDTAAEDGADVVGDVFGCDEGRDEKDAEEDGDGG
jgi:hypothetical protein